MMRHARQSTTLILNTAILLAFAAWLSAAPAMARQIIGGNNANADNWPGTASLQSIQGSALFHECGATMISQTWALTAAHCVEAARIDAAGRAVQFIPDADGNRVRFGPLILVIANSDLRRMAAGSVFPVNRIELHPDDQSGRPEAGADIALLRISG